MLCGSYTEGNAIKIRARPVGGTVTDASAWRLLTAGPDDTVSVEHAMIAEDGLAVATFTPDRPGRWRYRVEVSDPLGAIEATFVVKARSVPEPTP